MDLKIKKEWLQKHLEADEGYDFSAGTLMLGGEQEAAAPVAEAPLTEAFGTLIYLWRTERQLTSEKLAEIADIDEDEVQSIERDEAYRPEPRTVCALASVLKLPELPLLELTGNVMASDPDFAQNSLAFAANAKRWNQISKEQKKILHNYLKLITERAKQK